ncbi:MAG: alpha-glucosidase/alpha-galactosidase [Enterocloster asparagiformis]|nr:alpha-glucosidase/alpha-galactosidase [Enterocloster asparagiformis]
MIYTENKCRDINICYIGGGSQGWAWKLMSDLFLEESLSGTVRLYDIDEEASKANEAIGNRLSGQNGAKGEWKYISVPTLEEGLKGADFVIISILPATFEEMDSDVHAPEKYGIYQSVGDTTGPGGVFRALRTIPMYDVIADGIREYCPEAWVINYTNPMALCVGALYHRYPKIKAFGCCHEVFGAQRLLLMALKEVEGIEVEDRHQLRTNVAGINHFTWITGASWRNVDLMPVYRTFAEAHFEEGICDKITDVHFMSKNRVKFDLFRKHGAIAAAGDRHLAEFIPEYVRDPETVSRWNYSLTPVSYRIENKKMLNEKSRAYAAGEIEIPVEPSGEEGVAQMKALLGLGDLITNVNLPNTGQMDAGRGIVVETNALFTYNSVRPLIAGGLPDSVELYMNRHMKNQALLLKAAVNRDKELAFYVFRNDPMVSGLTYADAAQLFDEMFDNTRAYLPGY